MNVLTLNAGSNSLKYELVSLEPRAGDSDFGSSLFAGSYDDVKDHGQATEKLLNQIDRGKIQRVGHRVVHGADCFHAAALISPKVIEQIESLEDLAPLHNRSALAVIRAAQHELGPSIPMFAVFDTVFHQTIPDPAALYPIPLDLARKHKIRRYGFHGISHRYMLQRYARLTNRRPEDLNLITLHLEGGSSAAAIRCGKSIDTSMGFTPLEGLMMGTRSGDIDPAIVTYLMRKENLDSQGVEIFLNKKCGLLGVSGISADTRKLTEHLSDSGANLALSIFAYRVRKYVGAYLAAIGGVEAIVVGGGIGENTSLVRERIFENFAWCGAVLDPKRNAEVIDREGPITTPDSRIQIWVIPTRENWMIARETADAAA